MNTLYANKYEQEGISYISTILPMKYIIDNSEVLIYGQDPKYGYQRAPKKIHYNKIAKQLLSDEKKSVSPNSIVLGINEDDLEKKLVITNEKKGNYSTLLEMSFSQENNIKFRIIDGQHRIKGFQKAISECNNKDIETKLNNFPVNVIIMLLEKEHRLPEVYAFSDINSKAKPLKMDLTILAEYQYLLLEQPDEILNVERFLGTTVIEMLNSGNFCRYWTNGIIIDVNSSNRVGCVGFKSFYESIEPFCKEVIEGSEISKYKSFEEKKNVLCKYAEQMVVALGGSWNYVFEKWPISREAWIVEGYEQIVTYYNEDYYLQRTMGTFAINNIICSCIKKGNIDMFKEIINDCTLSVDDWNTMGLFSGLSSLSGANKIKEKILEGYVNQKGIKPF